MNDLFIRTMLKLQENKKVANKKLLKEDVDNNDIKDISDVDGFEHDVITVMDPELTTDEYVERQDEINKLIDETPEGEKVVDTEYVGMKIYQCPLCLTNFYAENEPAEEEKCPVCYETPEQFVYLGTVEQDMNDEDKELLDNAEDGLEDEDNEESTEEPAEETTDNGEGDSIDNELASLGNEEGTEEPAEENNEEEEDNRLTASKKVQTKGSIVKEDEERDPDAEHVKDLVDDQVENGVEINRDTIRGLLEMGAIDDPEYYNSLSDEEKEKLVDHWLKHYNDDKFESKKIEENKSLKENLEVGNQLSFKIKNNIVSAEITNIYVDDFNDKTYIQYTNPEGTRSGTMSADEILKGIEEGTIIAKIGEELPASVEEEPNMEEPVEGEQPEVGEVGEEPAEEITKEPVSVESKRITAFDYKDLTEDMKNLLKVTGKSEEVLEKYWYDKAGKPIVEKKYARVRKSK